MNGILDLKTALKNLVSLSSEQVAAGTLTGVYTDMDTAQGVVTALCNVGVATGDPTSWTAVFSLMEADDASATGAQAIPVQDDALTLSVGKTTGMLRGRRTKQFVAVKCVLTFVDGSTPKQSAFANVLSQLYAA